MKKLFYGDNLEVMQEHLTSGLVDLIYLDSSFKSNATNYNVIFKKHQGAGSAAQILAFEDTWHWTF